LCRKSDWIKYVELTEGYQIKRSAEPADSDKKMTGYAGSLNTRRGVALKAQWMWTFPEPAKEMATIFSNLLHNFAKRLSP